MTDNLVALGVDNTPINALGSFNEGRQAAAVDQNNTLKNAQATIEMIGSGAAYALPNGPDGEVDPAKYNEVLDGLGKMGIDVEKFRNNPNFAKVALQASITATERLRTAQSDRDYELAIQKFGADLTQQGIENARADQKLAMDAAGNADTGLQPIYGRDADGNVVVMQPNKSGQLIRSTMPDGVTVDLGVKSQEQHAGAKVGDVQGAAEAALATAPEAAGEVADKIKNLVNDPDLGVALGPIDSSLPNWTERSARVQGKIDQLKGVAFLQARQMLKGGGAITDYEGQKAEEAWARLGTAQNETDFKQALNDFNDAVQAGVKKLKKQAALDRNGGGGSGGGDDPMGLRP